MDWSQLEYFLAVARTGSLSAAAKQLQVNHSTVARRLDKLEQQLQVRLFDRLHNGYRLTEDGLALKQQAGQVEQKVFAAVKPNSAAASKSASPAVVF
jgi:DNA-binding transcriptional LysR family regulator